MAAAPQPRFRKEPSSSGDSNGRTERRLEGLTFVPLIPEYYEAIRECCESAVEIKLLLGILSLANEKEPGNPGCWIHPILPAEQAKLSGCTTANLRKEGKRLFHDWSLIEHCQSHKAVEEGFLTGDFDPRSDTFRSRVDPTNPTAIRRFLKARRAALKAKAEEEEARAAAAAAAEEEAKPERKPGKRTSLLPRPVQIGPKTVIELSPESREAIRGCTSISSARTGELKNLFIEDGKVLVLDFAPASAERGPRKDQASSATMVTDLGNGLLKTKDLRAQNPQELKLREGIDHLLLGKLGTAIDDRMFGQALDQIGPLDDQIVSSTLGLIRGSIRKITSHAYLVTAPKNGDSLITRARIAHQRQADLRRPTAGTNGNGSHRDLVQARNLLANREELEKANAGDLLEWAESVLKAGGEKS